MILVLGHGKTCVGASGAAKRHGGKVGGGEAEFSWHVLCDRSVCALHEIVVASALWGSPRWAASTWLHGALSSAEQRWTIWVAGCRAKQNEEWIPDNRLRKAAGVRILDACAESSLWNRALSPLHSWHGYVTRHPDSPQGPLRHGVARDGGGQQAFSEAGSFDGQGAYPSKSWRRSGEDVFVHWRGEFTNDVTSDRREWASTRTESCALAHTHFYRAGRLPRRNTL